jgi:dTDP-4-dehydrorhamnose reductase
MNRTDGIWLLGERGMLGRQLAGELRENGFSFFASDREVDIGDPLALQEYCRGRKIDWIINCAAYTAVDRAETENAAAFRVNARGPENLAKLAAGLGARLVHFSSDYVFDGSSRRPYKENDRPRPQSQYGMSKWRGDTLLAAAWTSVFIFRVSWLYGVFGGNFVQTMLRLFREKNEVRVVNDQFGSPTYAGTLAQNVVQLIAGDSVRYGLYHYSDAGVISWHEFAQGIMELALRFKRIDRPVPILPIPTADFPTPAPRPAYSALDSSRVRSELKFAQFDWKLNLEKYFREATAAGS